MNFKTPGIILRSYKYGESSRIIVFLTPVVGKLKASVKGVDRQKSKFSKPQLFNVYSLDVQTKRDREIDIIVSLELKESFLPILKSVQGYAAASYIVELTSEITGFSSEREPLFDEVLSVLKFLSKGSDPLRAVAFYTLKSLYMSGFVGSFTSCSRCAEVQGRFFIDRSGGMICEKCRKNAGGFSEIGAKIASLIEKVVKSPLNTELESEYSAEDVKQVAKVARLMLDFTLPKPLKSLDFLSSVLKKKKKERQKDRL